MSSLVGRFSIIFLCFAGDLTKPEKTSEFLQLPKAKVGLLFRPIVDIGDFPREACSEYFFIYILIFCDLSFQRFT